MCKAETKAGIPGVIRGFVALSKAVSITQIYRNEIKAHTNTILDKDKSGDPQVHIAELAIFFKPHNICHL